MVVGVLNFMSIYTIKSGLRKVTHFQPPRDFNSFRLINTKKKHTEESYCIKTYPYNKQGASREIASANELKKMF